MTRFWRFSGLLGFSEKVVVAVEEEKLLWSCDGGDIVRLIGLPVSSARAETLIYRTD